MSLSTKARLQAQSWQKDSFVISTNPQHFPISKLVSVFDSEDFYWSKKIPAGAMREMLDNSLAFGVYEGHPPANDDGSAFVGIARCVTDFATFAYLTDVWVDPVHQGKGLGTWLLRCVDEALQELPYLRRTVLYTGDWERSVPFYRKIMKMEVLEMKYGEGLAVMERKECGYPDYARRVEHSSVGRG